jgi:hypothetical protein
VPDDPTASGRIDPSLVEGALVDAFPGTDLVKSRAIGRRLVFKVAFSEFTLAITTPEESTMRKDTTLTFRRVVDYSLGPDKPTFEHQVFNYSDTFTPEEGDRLRKTIQWARAYVLGIVASISQALEEKVSRKANLFG